MFRTRTHPSAHTLAQPLAHTKACTQTCAEANAQACTHACTPARSSCARLRWDAAFQHMWNEKPNNCKARLSCRLAPTRCVPLCVCARICISLCPCICLRAYVCLRTGTYAHSTCTCAHACMCMTECGCTLHVALQSIVLRVATSCFHFPSILVRPINGPCCDSAAMACGEFGVHSIANTMVSATYELCSALQQWLADWLSKTSASEAPPAAAATLASSDTGGQRTEAERPQR